LEGGGGGQGEGKGREEGERIGFKRVELRVVESYCYSLVLGRVGRGFEHYFLDCGDVVNEEELHASVCKS